MHKFFLLFILVGCQTTQHVSVPKSNITLFFQSNRQGNLETCGCHTNPFGGIDRELNALKSYRLSAPQSLSLDGGNLFVPKERAGSVEHYRYRAQLMLPLLKEIGLDVFSPGPQDLFLGQTALKILASSASFRFLSANIKNKKGEYPFARSVTITKGGARYGILGVTPSTAASDDFVIQDPNEAIAEVLPQLIKTTDFVILLSQLGNKSDQALAERFSKISVIIGADELLATERPMWMKGHTLLVDSDLNGYLLGKLQLDLRFPVNGLYSAKDVETNKAHLKEYRDRGDKYASYADKLERVLQLSIPDGASLYEYELVKLDEKRFGSQNRLTSEVQLFKEAMRKYSLSHRQ
ncbi:MAG: hypothetical protein HYR96_03185 [Deltaproteobacteria bacterium]|nr:hypothetical protein [Deltaproteobacteria bacterium]MBI3294313.1 hypothetical protein [Deltaproteobacteria bacterium]